MTPEELRAFLAELGITVSDLARGLGIYRRNVQRWLSGVSHAPPYLVLALERIAQLIEGGESSP